MVFKLLIDIYGVKVYVLDCCSKINMLLILWYWLRRFVKCVRVFINDKDDCDLEWECDYFVDIILW